MVILSRASIVLVALVLVTLAGCYSPELRDCTVTCSAATECAADQVCDPDGYCTAPTMAGQCARIAEIDAGTGDAPPPDAATPMPDAPPPMHVIDVDITGDGSGTVAITGVGICSKLPPQNGNCMFTVEPRTLAITADPHLGSRFDKWEGAICKDQDETCVTMSLPITLVRAKFRRSPGD